MNLQFQNRLIEEVRMHPEVARAYADGDKEKAFELDRRLRLPNGLQDTSKLELVERFENNNINVLEGKMAALDRIAGVVTAAVNWYLGPWESDSTPDVSWDGDWASGSATEFIGYDEAGRQECVFGSATAASASRAEITNPTRTILTVSTGVDKNIYGVAISDTSTQNYGGGASILLAAVRYASSKNYLAGQVRYLGYQIFIP